MSLRLQRRSPFDIVCPMNGLEYKPQDLEPDYIDVRSDVITRLLDGAICPWPVSFQTPLKLIISHPIFLEGPEDSGAQKLTMMLQFVSICRTGFRGPWTWEYRSDSRVLEELREQLSPKHADCLQDGPSVWERFNVLNTASGNSMLNTANECSLMIHIGYTVKSDPTTLTLDKQLGTYVFPITSSDLRALQHALDTMDWRAMRPQTCETSYKRFLDCRLVPGVPAAGKLKQAMRQSGLHNLRKISRQIKARPEANHKSCSKSEEDSGGPAKGFKRRRERSSSPTHLSGAGDSEGFNDSRESLESPAPPGATKTKDVQECQDARGPSDHEDPKPLGNEYPVRVRPWDL